MNVRQNGLDISSAFVGVAGPGAMAALFSGLKALPGNAIVQLNYATGACTDSGETTTEPSTVVGICQSGDLWVDYGAYPFVNCLTGFDTLGFTAFLKAAGFASKITPPPPATYVGAPSNKDSYDFHLTAWSWGGFVANYPYAYGFPTMTNLRGVAGVKVPTTTPVGTAVPQQGNIYVYSMLAFRLGKGWYFYAQPGVSANTYLAFISSVVGAQNHGTTTNAQRQVSLSSTPAGSTPAQASAAGCLPSSTVAKYGATNNGYVAAVQNALRQKGYSLGTTGPAGNGVDGDFGPLTLTALNKWQGSKGVLNQNFGCGKVIVDKQMGPAVYKALGITAPASVGGSSAPPPASSGGSGGSGGGSKKGTTGHTVNPTGTWSGSGSTAKAYASVDGKNVLEKVPLAGGTLTIDGVVVTWGQAPGYSSGGGIFAGIFDDLAKALNTTPQNVELGAAGVVLLGVTLAVTQGGGKR